MAQAANVNSIDALATWKAALATFREDGQEAIGATATEIRRAFDWLQDKQRYWQQEVRRREELVVQAKTELRRKKTLSVTVQGKQPDTTIEEKALRKAQMLLEEAEQKLEKTRRWKPALEIDVNEYEGKARRLSSMLDGELMRGLVLLEQKIRSLEAYLAVPSSVEVGGMRSASSSASEAAAAPVAQPGIQAELVPVEPDGQAG